MPPSQHRPQTHHSTHPKTQHVLPLLREPAPSWHLLVGHYLGADHAGHSHGVGSGQMAAKLAQLDAQVATAIGACVESSRLCLRVVLCVFAFVIASYRWLARNS